MYCTDAKTPENISFLTTLLTTIRYIYVTQALYSVLPFDRQHNRMPIMITKMNSLEFLM